MAPEPVKNGYSVVIPGVGVRAPDLDGATELALNVVRRIFGGDTKRADWAMDRIGIYVKPVPDRGIIPGGAHRVTAVLYRRSDGTVSAADAYAEHVAQHHAEGRPHNDMACPRGLRQVCRFAQDAIIEAAKGGEST